MSLLATLPSQPSKRTTSPEGLIVCLYGPPGVGKTTTAASAKNSIILATEPGYKHLDGVFVQDIRYWDAPSEELASFGLLNNLKVLAKGQHDFKHIVIDTVDLAYDLCLQYECAKHHVDYPSGKDNIWGKITQEFKRVIRKLSMLGYGVLLISHVRVTEEETRVGPRQIITPSLPPNAMQAVVNACDMVLYAHVIDTEDGPAHMMQCKPAPHITAKDRTGLLPDSLPLSWHALIDAMDETVKGEN